MFDPNRTQRIINATRPAAKQARRGYAWASIAVMVMMFAGLCLRVILDIVA